MLEERIELGPLGGAEPSSSLLIRDLQTKLNDPWTARAGDGAKSTGGRPGAARLAGSDEGSLQARSKDVTGRVVNVPVKQVEEGGLEINRGLLANQACFLPNREVFIFSAKGTR